MPKQVDHQERRERIADAVCRLAARDGLEGVSLRHVAAEAGVSMGQVQHYFTDKDQMLLFAFEQLSERFTQRITDAAPPGGPPTSYRDRLRDVLVAMVSIDPLGRTEAPLWVAFLARAAANPDLAQFVRHDDLVAFGADHLRAAQDAGETSLSFDAEMEAMALFATADGLMLRCLLDPTCAETAIMAIDQQLDHIFETTPSR
ncbi:TetR/AcrR family transcriptional regulator [Leekyejoonella antrihumi]|nr:TetR/AcrR family transcriptional regulator [Leekyejoonella antrihumi]